MVFLEPYTTFIRQVVQAILSKLFKAVNPSYCVRHRVVATLQGQCRCSHGRFAERMSTSALKTVLHGVNTVLFLIVIWCREKEIKYD